MHIQKHEKDLFMKSLAIVFTVISIFLVACTDESTQINQLGVESYESVDNLPECKSANEGELAQIKGEASVRICSDGKWFATLMADSTRTAKYACSTKKLSDGSGLKIICNGDSIGVVLFGSDGRDGEKGEDGDKGDQGEKGEKGDTGKQGVAGKDGETGENGSNGKDGIDGKDGKDGKDGAVCSLAGRTDASAIISCGDSIFVIELGYAPSLDTFELDSEMVATKLDSLEGYTQKGPFLKGSSVFLYELSDGRTLKQTNGNFATYITRDDGRYIFSARNLVSQYAMIVVEGNYRNEVTGENSNKPIRLRAISDMTERSSANVNLLTNIEFDRVYNLVTNKKMKVRNAKKQAQAEIFNAFYIDTTGFSSTSEDLDVFGETDEDAALLAISILLQGDSNEIALTMLLTDIASDLEIDGKWDDSTTRMRIADWVIKADTTKRFRVFRNNVEKWNLSQSSIPEFEKYMRKFWSMESGLGVCGEGENQVGVVKYVKNPKSRYYARYYTDLDTTGGKIRFICADKDSAKWIPAKNIEKDTMNWGNDWEEGKVMNGQINVKITYVFQDHHWREGTKMDSLLHQACLEDGQISDTTYEDFYYRCEPSVDGAIRGWKKVDELFNDVYEYQSECKTGGLYSRSQIVPGRYNTDKFYVCDNGEFRLANEREVYLKKGCTSYNKGAYIKAGESEYAEYGFTCEAGSTISPYLIITRNESKYGRMTDSRDGQKYYTINIRNKTWMAENLRFEYKVNGQTYGNYCVDDGCESFGRFYTWAAAMDSAGVYSDGGKGCGYGEDCTRESPVRGICPEGWHLPTQGEWTTLYSGEYYTANDSVYALQAIGYDKWDKATDKHGFSILPAGTGYGSVGTDACFWTSSLPNPYYGYTAIIWRIRGNVVDRPYDTVAFYNYSVRCVKNN